MPCCVNSSSTSRSDILSSETMTSCWSTQGLQSYFILPPYGAAKCGPRRLPDKDPGGEIRQVLDQSVIHGEG